MGSTLDDVVKIGDGTEEGIDELDYGEWGEFECGRETVDYDCKSDY
jgi:hypothetical protein